MSRDEVLRASISASFWSAFVPCATQNKDAVQLTLEQIDVIKRLVDKYPQYLQFATSVTDILEAHSARPRKIASLIVRCTLIELTRLDRTDTIDLQLRVREMMLAVKRK